MLSPNQRRRVIWFGNHTDQPEAPFSLIRPYLPWERLTWHYKKYSKDVSLGELEHEARAAKRGLWVEPGPVPPWCYLKRQKGREC